MPDEPTMGELGRWIKDVQTTVHDLSDKIEHGYVRHEAVIAMEQRIMARITTEAARTDSLEGSRGAVVRLVLSAVGVALLALVLKQSGVTLK